MLRANKQKIKILKIVKYVGALNISQQSKSNKER